MTTPLTAFATNLMRWLHPNPKSGHWPINLCLLANVRFVTLWRGAATLCKRPVRAVSKRSCWNLYALRIFTLPWQYSSFAGKVYLRVILYWLKHKMGDEIVDENEKNIEGRLHGEQIEPDQPDNMLQRFIHMMLLAMMISLAQTVLGVATVVQFVVMLANKKQPNEQLADFGTYLGIWIAKAARFQTAASNVKPWPWTKLN